MIKIKWETVFNFFIINLLLCSLFSCAKTELYGVSGIVVDEYGNSVSNATIEIFTRPEDWLTGQNVLVTMVSDRNGDFESSKIYESGSFYIFVKKLDSSNWNIRDVEQAIYPQIELPLSNKTVQVITRNNMSLLANSEWEITNVLLEYSNGDNNVTEWQSIWESTNNCIKDNSLHFGKDLSVRFCEGTYMCMGSNINELGVFVPPMIFSSMGCTNLIHTNQKVKPFEISGWTEMEGKDAVIYLDCDLGLNQIYLIYKHTPSTKRLHVYSRF
ncbi:MAG: hypothetical protein ACI85Q_000609 [Salibacteraceae bacterium]|jgi:hypothetical protein